MDVCNCNWFLSIDNYNAHTLRQPMTTSSISSQTSNIVIYTSDPYHQPHLTTTHLQPSLILPNIPATIEPVPSGAAGGHIVRRNLHERPYVSMIPVHASQSRRVNLPSSPLPRIGTLPASVSITPVPYRGLQTVFRYD